MTKHASGLIALALATSLMAPVAYAQTTAPGMDGTGSDTTVTPANGTGINGETTGTGAVTDTTTGVGEDMVTTPGVPNTGAGGESMLNFLILLSTGIGAVVSVMLLRRAASVR